MQLLKLLSEEFSMFDQFGSDQADGVADAGQNGLDSPEGLDLDQQDDDSCQCQCDCPCCQKSRGGEGEGVGEPGTTLDFNQQPMASGEGNPEEEDEFDFKV